MQWPSTFQKRLVTTAVEGHGAKLIWLGDITEKYCRHKTIDMNGRKRSIQPSYSVPQPGQTTVFEESFPLINFLAVYDGYRTNQKETQEECAR